MRRDWIFIAGVLLHKFRSNSKAYKDFMAENILWSPSRSPFQRQYWNDSSVHECDEYCVLNVSVPVMNRKFKTMIVHKRRRKDRYFELVVYTLKSLFKLVLHLISMLKQDNTISLQIRSLLIILVFGSFCKPINGGCYMTNLITTQPLKTQFDNILLLCILYSIYIWQVLSV